MKIYPSDPDYAEMEWLNLYLTILKNTHMHEIVIRDNFPEIQDDIARQAKILFIEDRIQMLIDSHSPFYGFINSMEE